MSQLSFLESVVTWDDTTCKQNLHEALPKLIAHLQDSTVIQEELGILKIICVSFLPWVEIEQAESAVYSHVSLKSCGMLDKVLSQLEEMPKKSSLQSELHMLIELLSELLQCFTECFQHATRQGGNSVNLSSIHSLPCGAIHLLKGTYTHCKESSTVYGDVLTGVTEPLSALFKKAHALQQCLLNMLENVVLDNTATDQEIQTLTEICEGLFAVCQVVSSLDVKLVVSLWKSVSRLSGRHKHHVRDTLHVDEMVGYLCSEIQQGYSYLLQLAPPQQQGSELSLSQGDSAAFQKSLKVVGYQLRVVISLLDNFVDQLTDSVTTILHMVISVLRTLPPSLEQVTIAPQYIEDIRKHLVNGVDPLMNLLGKNRPFLHCLVKELTEVKPADRLAYIQVMVKLLDCLPKQSDEVYRSWLEIYRETDNTCTSVIHLLMSVLTHAHVELSLCTVDQTNRPLSLYQHVIYHLCGFVASLPAVYFKQLEACLLEHVFSPAPLVARMVQDLWCFTVRYGSADLCYSHVTTLLDLCSHLNSPDVLVRLIRRLIKFLAPDHMTKVLTTYPYKTYPTLWSSVFLHVPCTGKDVTKIAALCQKVKDSVKSFLEADHKTYGDLLALYQDLLTLSSLLQNDSNQRLATVAVETVHKLWLSWDSSWSGERIFTHCLVEMTELAGLVVASLDNQCMLQVLITLQSNLPTDDNSIKLACCKLLHRCKKVRFSPDSQQPQLLKKIPALFHTLLLDTDPLVHLAALEAFTAFAESTPYETLVPECLRDDQQLQDRVVAFLSKRVQLPEGYSDIECLRQEDGLISTVLTCPPRETSDLDTAQEISAQETIPEPSSKRKRCDNSEDVPVSSVDTVLSELDRSIQALELLTLNEALPSQAVMKLGDLTNRMKTVLHKCS